MKRKPRSMDLFSDATYVWVNQYQLVQSFNYLGAMYGVTSRVSGTRIFCACGKDHSQKRKKSSKSTVFLQCLQLTW